MPLPFTLHVVPPCCLLLLQGQLLGIGGKQLQRIKQESSARLQVNNAEGNLNGSHPDPLDPNLHALISADSVVSCLQSLICSTNLGQGTLPQA
jgi:hypothetical protein